MVHYPAKNSYSNYYEKYQSYDLQFSKERKYVLFRKLNLNLSVITFRRLSNRAINK